MTPQNTEAKNKSLTRTAMAFCITTVCLALTVVFMAMAIFAQKDKVILVPSLLGETEITEGSPSPQYVEQLTRDVASLFLNRHPHNGDYFEKAILRIVHAKAYQKIEEELRGKRDNRIRSRTSTVFHPVEIYVRNDGRYSEITGFHQTIVGKDVTDAGTRIYAANWVTEGLTVRLMSFEEIERRTSDSAKLELQRDGDGDE